MNYFQRFWFEDFGVLLVALLDADFGVFMVMEDVKTEKCE